MEWCPVRSRGTLKMPQSAAWHDGMMPQSAAWPLEPDAYLVHNSRYAHCTYSRAPPSPALHNSGYSSPLTLLRMLSLSPHTCVSSLMVFVRVLHIGIEWSKPMGAQRVLFMRIEYIRFYHVIWGVPRYHIMLLNMQYQLSLSLDMWIGNCHFKNSHTELSCPLCGRVDDSQEHVLVCSVLMKNISCVASGTVEHNHIFHSDVTKQSAVTRTFLNLWKSREKMIKKGCHPQVVTQVI